VIESKGTCTVRTKTTNVRKQMIVPISGWEKFRKAVTGSYSEKLKNALDAQHARAKAVTIAAEKVRLEVAAKAKADRLEAMKAAEVKKAAEIKAATKPAPKAAAKKAPAKPAAEKKPVAKKPLKEATRDGDGDGFINDGKPNERKVTPKKKK
jgi:membrane protein involved in colicin uptake